MIRFVAWLALSVAALALLVFEAPRAGVLTTAPERGKVGRTADDAHGPSVRTGPLFVPFGGGFHGGK